MFVWEQGDPDDEDDDPVGAWYETELGPGSDEPLQIVGFHRGMDFLSVRCAKPDAAKRGFALGDDSFSVRTSEVEPIRRFVALLWWGLRFRKNGRRTATELQTPGVVAAALQAGDCGAPDGEEQGHGEPAAKGVRGALCPGVSRRGVFGDCVLCCIAGMGARADGRGACGHVAAPAPLSHRGAGSCVFDLSLC